MKEQGKNPPKQTNEEEIGRLPEKEFMVNMIQNRFIEWRKYKKHFKRT